MFFLNLLFFSRFALMHSFVLPPKSHIGIGSLPTRNPNEDIAPLGYRNTGRYAVKDIENIPPRQLVSMGMKRFTEGNVEDSIELFDRSDLLDSSLTPFLWQRGISLYYTDQFQQGSNQFRYDVKVNPSDVEEIVWDIACQNRLKIMNPEYEVRALALPPGKKDRRKIMGVVYSLFRGDGATEGDLATAGHSGSISEDFYALFYLGLYCESLGEVSKAEKYMKAAAKSEYAQGRGASDYMTACAKVQCNLRGWV